MSLRWGDERYVRVYTHDTPDWAMLSGEAQGLFYCLLRKVDRVGTMPLGKAGIRGLARIINWQFDFMEPLLRQLLADGCIEITDESVLVIPNYLEAQEVPISDAQRKREQRSRDRARHLEKRKEKQGSHVTGCHEVSRGVTKRHSDPSLSDPSLSDPSLKELSPISSGDGFEFEQVYSLYPRKLGHKKGIQRCRSQIKTREKYDALLRAVRNYSAAKTGTDPQYIAHFDTWMNGKWEDWVNPDPTVVGRSPAGWARPSEFSEEDMGNKTAELFK